MKKNVAVLMGGYSSEYEISMKSGLVVIENLDKETYNSYRIIISKKELIYLDENNNKFKINKGDFSIQIDNEKIVFDVALIMIHGSPGEDGKLQSYFELLRIPYTGSSSYSSAITFNKRDCISVLKKHNIPSAKSVYLNLGDKIDEDKIINKIGLPCFVKANRSGSSFGIYMVKHKKDLTKSIEESLKIDSEVLI